MLRHIFVSRLDGILRIIAAAVAEGVAHPVSFDELHESRMLVVNVADVAASRERARTSF
jgi:hypothetical protein